MVQAQIYTLTQKRRPQIADVQYILRTVYLEHTFNLLICDAVYEVRLVLLSSDDVADILVLNCQFAVFLVPG